MNRAPDFPGFFVFGRSLIPALYFLTLGYDQKLWTMDFSIDKSMDILERTPAVLTAMLAGIDEAWTSVNEGGETWTVYDVIGHLIHGDKTDWMPRAEIILADNPDRTFKPFDRSAQFATTKKSLEQLLDEFSTVRKKKY